MSKTSIDERATEWSILLNLPPDHSAFNLSKISKELKIFPYFALILHDRDKNELGELKTPHIHIALKTDRTRKQSLINKLGELLDFPSECISVDKLINFRKYNRYLLHYDEESKEKYAPFEIYTNDTKYFNSLLIEREINLSEEDLIKIVKEEKTTTRILLKIGMENYKKYRFIINDLQKEIALLL